MKKMRIWALVAALCLLLTACGEKEPPTEQQPDPDSQQTQQTGQNGGGDTTPDSGKDTVAADPDMFTDRDLRTSYDESKAAVITLNGSSAVCTSNAVSVQGGTVTILDEGTYLLTGTLTDGRIVVDAPTDAKPQLVLRNVSVHSDISAALYVKNADKVVVTLEGENALTCGERFIAVDENNIDGAVYAKADLTFNGAGSLRITSPAGHGIVGKDDLVFTGGSYDITCASHGVDANDSVRCVDADFTVASGKDAIHAENTEDASLGFVYIQSGTFLLSAEGDGISAGATLEILGGSFDITCGGGSENGTKQSSDNWGGYGGGMMPPGGMGGGKGPGGKGGYGGMSFGGVTTDTTAESTSMKAVKSVGKMTVSGGSFTVDSADDAFHSNSDLTVSGGSFTVATGDDGFHADENLTVSDGTITVTASYEGLEGHHITVSGGKIRLVSTDDGINAAGGTDQSGSGGRDQFGGMGGPGGMGGFGMGSGDGSVTISGGEIYMNASGDGIDANGTLEISGGYTVVCGPTQGDTAVLDYDKTAVITGGTFIGTGSTMMAQTFSEGSTQGVFAVTCGSQQAGTPILLRDASGAVVVDYVPDLPFGLVVLSTPDMVSGAEYTITVGEASGTFAAS